MSEKTFTIARKAKGGNQINAESLIEPLSREEILDMVLKEFKTLPNDIGIRLNDMEETCHTILNLGFYRFDIVFPSFAKSDDLSDAEPLVIPCKLWVIADTPPPPELPEKTTFNDRCASDVACIADNLNAVIDYLKHKEENA